MPAALPLLKAIETVEDDVPRLVGVKLYPSDVLAVLAAVAVALLARLMLFWLPAAAVKPAPSALVTVPFRL